ncbi:hypothetical protein V4287_000396 [Serratia marcescens]|uniref:hypothetical protein n=2 Tax=Serratia marcescens TaxID=615 RepID=UPI00066858A0|nr:hypothetical protein [Serratia marcescens]MBH3149734.1 hypothetical protein [Serratia marcescens]MBH3164703.1 hypothetical protein [Serratia marcescens]HEJ6966010.1 hypothetical protein [Serratia marcescens]HEJ7011221.1 hypothetical protein [Serratia marcescens]HEJ7201444.1 hypothetical protein [Serratia marcescens]
MDVDTIIVSALISMVISLIGAWVTMRLALHRFYREKWWDKRATAYLELVDVLYDFKESYGVIEASELAKVITDHDGEPIYPEDILSDSDESELWKKMQVTHYKLAKIKGLGPLIFTEAALNKVSAFINRDNNVRRMVLQDEIYDVEAYGEMKAGADNLYQEFKTIVAVELKLTSGVKSKLDGFIQWVFSQYIRAEDEYRKNIR